MLTQTLMDIFSDRGINVAIFGLLVWMVVYIVKRLANVVDKLSVKLDRFTDRVRAEHDAFKDSMEKSNEGLGKAISKFEISHAQLQEQHKGMIETLGRINGYKH